MPPSEDPFLYELEDDLHDLCQPLTALHFRLELGKFAGDPEALREAVDGALEETNRMIDTIKRMRERLNILHAGSNRSTEGGETPTGRQNMAGRVSN